MKLASFDAGHGERYGIVRGDAIIDLTDRLAPLRSLQEFVAAGRLSDAVRAAERGGGPEHRLEDVRFLPPILRPEKIWCIGVNYADRNAEYKDASDQPRYPSLFARSIRSFVGHGATIERPRVSAQLDYEGEIALVIGRECKHLSLDTALDHVFGVTLCNEGTVRDWLKHGKFNVTQGKNFDRSGSIGPWIVTADEIDLRAPLALITRVNGEIRQNDSTDRLIFSFPELLVYLSTFATLAPGDLIVTGTPTGAGVRLNPPQWLVPGDIIEVEVAEIGVLRNTVADEARG